MKAHEPFEERKIIIKLKGGLGNQLFQYALGRHLAIKNRANLYLDTSWYRNVARPDKHRGKRIIGLHHYSIEAEFIDYQKYLAEKGTRLSRLVSEVIRRLQKRIPYYYRTHIVEPKRINFTFSPKIYSLEIKNDKYLDGYWQTEKYFIGIRETLLNDLTLKHKPDRINQQFLDQINKSNSVAIHVRHTDNVGTVFGALPKSYYDEAIRRMAEFVSDISFFVFSDNIPHAKSLFDHPYAFHFIEHNGDEKDYEDLRLMASCKHHIIANSTFSWWGAWLATFDQQIVIAPRYYYQERNKDNPGFYPEEWILI